MRRLSSHWGAIPQKEPITIARKVEIKVDNTPIVQGNPAAVPEHGKNIPSHGIRSK